MRGKCPTTVATDVIKIGLDHGIEWVRGLGISVRDLQDAWRPAFVFSTLLLGAIARNSRNRGWLFAAPVGALAIAVWSGLTGSLGPVAFAVAAALTAFVFAAFAFAGNVFLTVILAAVAFAVFTQVVYAAVVALKGVGVDIEVAIGAILALAASVYLLAGFFESRGSGWRALSVNANFKTGIDILFTMAFAFAIAVAVANPPIW